MSAVARIQIQQVYEALYNSAAELVGEHVAHHIMSRSLDDLRRSTAYQWNRDFRETIDRLVMHHERHPVA